MAEKTDAYNYLVTAHRATAVYHCITGNFVLAEVFLF